MKKFYVIICAAYVATCGAFVWLYHRFLNNFGN